MAFERDTQELRMSKAEPDDEEQRAGSSAHEREDVSIEAVAAASTMQASHTEALAPGTTDAQSLAQAPTPPIKAGPTMEDVYKRIMEQKVGVRSLGKVL